MRGAATLVVRNVVWLGVGEVVLKGALFAAGVVVARGLGPAAMGSFTIGYGAAVVLMLLLTAGQVEVVIREVARRPSSGVDLARLARAWQIRVAAVAVPVALGGSLLIREPVLRWTLFAFIPYAWLRSRLITVGAVFKGLDRMEVEVAGRAAELGGALVLLVALAATGGPVWASGLAFGVGAAVGVGVVLSRLRRLAAGEGAGVGVGYLAREGWSFMGLALASQALMRVDTFLLASLGVAREAIGRYGVASAPVWGLLGVSQLLSLALYPTLARAATGGALGVRRVLAFAAAGVGLGVALALLLNLCRAPLLRLVFGPPYLAAEGLLARLAWALPGACASMLLGSVVAACGRQAWALVLQATVLVMAVAGYLAVIPRWGPAGCAQVVVAVQTLGMLGTLGVALAAARRPVFSDRRVFAGVELE